MKPRWLDPIELLGLASLAVLAVGLSLVNVALALIVIGAIGFGLAILATRNRSRPKRRKQ